MRECQPARGLFESGIELVAQPPGKKNQSIALLSGGERARVLIAQLMLQPADVLLLDEPTNDLDIPTLEILEESLLEYRGALVLVGYNFADTNGHTFVGELRPGGQRIR